MWYRKCQGLFVKYKMHRVKMNYVQTSTGKVDKFEDKHHNP